MKISSSLLQAGLTLLALTACNDDKAATDGPSGAPASAGAMNGSGGMSGVATATPNATTERLEPPQASDVPKVEGSVRGQVNGADFVPSKVAWTRGKLDFEIGDNPMFPDVGIRVIFRKPENPYAIPFGRSFVLAAGDKRPEGLEVHVRYRTPDTRAQNTDTFTTDFALNLKFEEDRGEGGLFGRIHLVTSNPGHWISGTFEAGLAGSRVDGELVNLHENSKETLSFLVRKEIEKQLDGATVEIVRVYEPRFQKTNIQLYIAYIELDLLIDGEPETRSATMARTVDGWAVDTIMDKNQIPEAYPPLEPLPPPDGDKMSWINYIVARRVQSIIDSESPGMGIMRYTNAIKLGTSCASSRVKFKLEGDPKARYYEFFVVADSVGIRIDREVVEGEKIDLEACKIVPE